MSLSFRSSHLLSASSSSSSSSSAGLQSATHNNSFTIQPSSLGFKEKMSATAFSSICFDRAHSWNKDLIKQHNVKPHVKCSIKSQLSSQKVVRVGVLGASGYTGSEGTSCFVEKHKFCLSAKPFYASKKTGPKISCAMNMSAHQSDDDRKMKLDQVIDKARKLWDSSPEPVKKFPWNRALGNFIQLVLDLTLAVVKYLSVPLFIVTSISELSYCAHERKLVLVPFPVLLGASIAGILSETALELSPRLRVAEVPWHLIAIAIFFTLIKLPGPYYPYWGRILIPHFVNGVLLRTLWFAILWFRRPKALKMSDSIDNS